jgi:hypothetical protein
MAESPTGSRHRYFRRPKDQRPIPLITGWRHGIDIKGEGGMVLAPPSRKGDKAYRWLNQLPIAEAPQWLLDLIREGRERVSKAGDDSGLGRSEPERADAPETDDPENEDAPIEKTRLALEVIPHNGDTDRTRWVSVGRILHRTYGQEGFALFKTWSYSGNYKPADGDEELQRVWVSFETDLLHDADPARRIKIGSLYRWADEADPERAQGLGWRTRW